MSLRSVAVTAKPLVRGALSSLAGGPALWPVKNVCSNLPITIRPAGKPFSGAGKVGLPANSERSFGYGAMTPRPAHGQPEYGGPQGNQEGRAEPVDSQFVPGGEDRGDYCESRCRAELERRRQYSARQSLLLLGDPVGGGDGQRPVRE